MRQRQNPLPHRHRRQHGVHQAHSGNGRLGRFLMNLQLGSGGHPWTVLRVDRRGEYMSALDRASCEDDVVPFVRFVLEEMRAGEEN